MDRFDFFLFIYDGARIGPRNTGIYTNHDKAERQEYISRNGRFIR